MIWLIIIYLKLYQSQRITWWCLSILEFVLKSDLQYVMLEKIFKRVMVSQNFCQTHLLEVVLTKFMGDHETLFIVRHVDFSSLMSSLGL
jgi:hypothetical protein